MEALTIKYFEDDIRILEDQLYQAQDKFKKMLFEKVESKGLMYYSGFVGTIETQSPYQDTLVGRIVGIPDLVTYESSEGEDIRVVFENAVDDYIETLESLEKWNILDRGSVI